MSSVPDPHDTYTETIDSLSAGQALQRLYSYLDSTGADVGAVVQALEEVDKGALVIPRIEIDGQQYRKPDTDNTDRHFVEIVGDAREAADGRYMTPSDLEPTIEELELIVKPTLESSAETFDEITTFCNTDPAFDDTIVDELEQIAGSYHHMVNLAVHATRELKNRT